MSAVSNWSTTVLPWVEAMATLAFPLSGILESARKRLDAVGVCTVAFLCAFGGRTLRDLLLDQRPFPWVRHTELRWAVVAVLVLQWHLDAQTGWALWVSASVTAGLRGLALWKQWSLPSWRN